MCLSITEFFTDGSLPAECCNCSCVSYTNAHYKLHYQNFWNHLSTLIWQFRMLQFVMPVSITHACVLPVFKAVEHWIPMIRQAGMLTFVTISQQITQCSFLFYLQYYILVLLLYWRSYQLSSGWRRGKLLSTVICNTVIVFSQKQFVKSF